MISMVLDVALLLWSLCTFFTPIAADMGNSYLIAVRILLGAGEGLAFPSIHSERGSY